MKSQSIHPHMVKSVVTALQETFFEGGYADKVIERALKGHRKWGSRDRRFFAEQVYGIVRWWRKYWQILGETPSNNPQALLKIWAIHHFIQHNEIPDLPELRGFLVPRSQISQAEQIRAIRESVPDWIDEIGVKEFGSRWDSILESLNLAATVDLRVNRLRATRKQVQEELRKDQIETDPIETAEDGLTLRERKNVFMTKAYLSGHFEVQDRASQLVAPFLKVSPGLRVIDACAGAGGKSLHIASLMKNKGKLISMDIHEWKLNELRKRASRNGVDIIETKLIDSTKVIKRLEGAADRVLLDVPCTGLGVLRRNPDTKWKLRPEDMAEIHQLQSDILNGYSEMVKIGGMLVYATCSFLPSENEEQVERFLAEHPNWKLEEQLRVNPDEGKGDGFFAARMLKLS